MVRITISLTPCERGKTYATDAAERELRTSQHVMSKDDQRNIKDGRAPRRRGFWDWRRALRRLRTNP